MRIQSLCTSLAVSVLALVVVAAEDGRPVDSAPPEVKVVQPISREVRDHEDFAGRTEASATVTIKARVSGYLDKVLFKDGAQVKKGDLLFQIDPRPYEAELKKAEAELTLREAALTRLEGNYKRAQALVKDKAISQEKLDAIVAERDEARARLRSAAAAREAASLNLDFTRVTAPMNGRIGRRRLDAGNLVKADETDLATLTSSKPIYVYFDIDERTALHLRKMTADSKGTAKGQGLQVGVQLIDEKDFPRRADVDFVANRVNPATGTLSLRVTLPNADGLMVPGMFVRLRLTTSKPYKALLVPRQAVDRDLSKIGRNSGPGWGFVMVAKGNKLVVREVQIGAEHAGLITVKEGLRADDLVVQNGPNGLKEGMTIKAKKVAMPAEKE